MSLHCCRFAAASLVLLHLITAHAVAEGEVNPRLSPDQVENQIVEDSQSNPLYESRLLTPVRGWKDQLAEEYGVKLGLDYSSVVIAATDSPGEDYAAGGMVRFFGSWDLVNRNGPNQGSLIWKAEHRHRYTTVSVKDFGFESGYVGLFEPPFNDDEFRLTNLYWKQKYGKGRGTLIAGFLDVTDFVDVYLLASPWTGFMNLVFSTGSASMDLPNDATLGVGTGYMISKTVYAQAGIADANADPTEPFDGFESVVDDSDFYKWVEIGWTPGQEQIYFDNAHITFWHADERANRTPDGWGLNVSYQRFIKQRWLPFVRGGYTHDSGSLLEYSVATGVGYQPVPKRGVVGLGVNWGKPNEASFGDLDEQLTTELFWRYQLTKELAVTPGVQYINNPALNPNTNHMWVFALRGRLAF